jgi:hypothetical protein
VFIYEFLLFIHSFGYLEEVVNSSTSSRWQWPKLTANSQSLTSQSSLSPPIAKPMSSTSLPTSPLDTAFANSAVYVASDVGLHKSVSVR